ncbi:hypothetical protein CGC45_01625 [Francisella opportunistica]|nr:hypothetical protein CGC45_01625 [Francisella opportunistica]
MSNFSYGMQKAFTPYLPTKSSNVTKIDFSHVSIDYSNQNKGKYKKLSETLEPKSSLNDINEFLRHNPKIDLVIANQLLHKLSFLSFEACDSFFQIIEYPNNDNLNTFKNALNRYRKFAAAQKAFDEAKAKQQKLADAVTYTSFIDAAGKNGKFEQALQAFKEAEQLEDNVLS